MLQYRYSYIFLYKTTHPPTQPFTHPPTQPFDSDVHLSTHWVFPTSRWFTKDIFCQAKVCYCIAQAQDGGTAVGTRWPRITRIETHNLRGFEGIWYFLLRILKNVKRVERKKSNSIDFWLQFCIYNFIASKWGGSWCMKFLVRNWYGECLVLCWRFDL